MKEIMAKHVKLRQVKAPFSLYCFILLIIIAATNPLKGESYISVAADRALYSPLNIIVEEYMNKEHRSIHIRYFDQDCPDLSDEFHIVIGNQKSPCFTRLTNKLASEQELSLGYDRLGFYADVNNNFKDSKGHNFDDWIKEMKGKTMIVVPSFAQGASDQALAQAITSLDLGASIVYVSDNYSAVYVMKKGKSIAILPSSYACSVRDLIKLSPVPVEIYDEIEYRALLYPNSDRAERFFSFLNSKFSFGTFKNAGVYSK